MFARVARAGLAQPDVIAFVNAAVVGSRIERVLRILTKPEVDLCTVPARTA